MCLDVNVSLYFLSFARQGMLANEKSKGMGDQEEGMDLADEIDMGGKVTACVTSECHDVPRIADGFMVYRIRKNAELNCRYFRRTLSLTLWPTYCWLFLMCSRTFCTTRALEQKDG